MASNNHLIPNDVEPTKPLVLVQFHNAIKLTPTNYITWKTQIQSILIGYGLEKFIDGSHPAPPETEANFVNPDVQQPNPAYSTWLRQDKLLFGALVGTLSENVASLVMQAGSSREAWKILEDTYAKPSTGHIQQITELASKMSFMDDNLYKAARLKGTGIPSSDDVNYILHQTPDEENVLHIAARHGSKGFIKTVLDRFTDHCYKLVCHQNSHGETPLHLATQFGDEEVIQDLILAHDTNPNEMKPCWSVGDKKGDTPLHKALKCRHDDIALLLLEKDMGLNSRLNNLSESPTYLAAENFCLGFLRTILDPQRYDQNSVSVSGPLGQTVVHPARKLTGDLMSMLIQKRKELLTVQDSKGKTVLHYAVEEKREPMVKTLLNAESSLAYLRDNDGLTPLHRATKLGLFSMVRIVLELSPQSIHIRTSGGETALHVAKSEAPFLAGCLMNTRMKELINVADNQGNTPLHLAFMASKLDIANTLLGVAGINWKLRNNDGCTSMDLCKSEDQIPKNLELLESTGRVKEVVNMSIFNHKDVKNVKDLLDHYTVEECLTYKGPQGNNILHLAAENGCMRFINAVRKSNPRNRLLLLTGLNSKEETPLHLAAASGHLKVVKAIIQLSLSTNISGGTKGLIQLCVGEDGREYEEADITPWKMTSVNGDTPLHEAVRNGHEEVAMSIMRCDPELASCENEASESVLYLAAQNLCHRVIAEILVNARDAYSVSGPDGKNPLHAIPAVPVIYLNEFRATSKGFTREDNFKSTLKNLIEGLPNLLNKVDNSGKTPLHYAVEQNRPEAVGQMLRVDKSPALVYDNEGHTPLLRAAAKGHHECVRAILDCCPHSAQLCDFFSDAHFSQLDAPFENPLLKIFRGGGTSLEDATKENVKRHLNNMALTATLFVTLTFAAAFTIPGGYNQFSGQVLRMKETPVKVFLCFDIIAMMTGMAVILISTFAATRDITRLLKLMVNSAHMLRFSLFATIMAFIAGIYALASHDAIGIFIAAVVFAPLLLYYLLNLLPIVLVGTNNRNH